MRRLTVNEILPLLQGVNKAGAGYKAICPLHSDNNASLSINEDSDGNAVINCFAGCDQGALWRYLRERAGVISEDNKPKQAARLVCEYEYKNAAGDIVDIKQRFQPGYNGAKKSFLWKIKTANRREKLPPYNLLAIIKAPQDSIIFLCEGEKDVNELTARGIIASSTRDGITPENAHYFEGRELAIISDNDKAGRDYANKAAAILARVAKSIKVIDTSDFYENAPQKSDITDYLQAGGDLAAVYQAIERAPFFCSVIPQDVTTENNKNPLTPYYANVSNCYISSDNILTYKNGDNITPLCFGALAIKSEITKNNGVENEIYFEILAATLRGDLLPPCYVSANEFNSLNWIIKNYGARVAITSSQSAKQKLLTALTLTGLNCERRRVFSHFGYIYNEDRTPRDYLHFGGDLLGDQAIKCEIDNNLRRYTMTAPGDSDEIKTAINASLQLLTAHNPAVVYPLFSFCYLAALSPVVRDVLGDQGFLFYLQGKTQSGKSTLAALVTSHFGNFTASTPPASFLATANAINELAFILKDSILWIDDFYPKENPNERKKINGIFQNIARAAGDQATRARLNSDSKLKTNHPPRCLFLVTGEDKPDIGQSGAARVFSVYVPNERHNIEDIQAAARSGDLARSMSAYINYIIRRYQDVKSDFEQMYNLFYANFSRVFGAVRLSNQAALLSTSLLLFLKFAVISGAISKERAKEIKAAGVEYISKAAGAIENNITDSDPVNIYIDSLRALISAGRVSLIDLDINTNLTSDFVLSDKYNIIGYQDKLFIYLDSNLAYRSVCNYQAGELAFFGISKTTIQRELLERGYIISRDNNPQITKTICKRSVRLLKFNRELLAPSGDQAGRNKL